MSKAERNQPLTISSPFNTCTTQRCMLAGQASCYSGTWGSCNLLPNGSRDGGIKVGQAGHTLMACMLYLTRSNTNLSVRLPVMKHS